MSNQIPKILFADMNDRIIPSVTREEMKEIDTIAINQTGPGILQMMENAGRNLSIKTIESLNGNCKAGQIVVLAGKGGNGGGGICAARHLKNKGFDVVVATLSDQYLSDSTALQKLFFKNSGGDFIKFEELPAIKSLIILDALIGYNLNRTPEGIYSDVIQWANKQKCKIISLDIPSGVDANDGTAKGSFIKPDETLTLGLPKTGCLPEVVGDLYLGDIGISTQTLKMAGIQTGDFCNPISYVIRLKVFSNPVIC
ncbi:MAG: hypothetical protein Kow0098_23780 [Ignavibacteriaceae bacterium]